MPNTIDFQLAECLLDGLSQNRGEVRRTDLEFADDSTNFAVVLGGGIQYRFSKRFATSLTQYEVFSDPTGQYRRFDATVLSLDFLF